MYKHKPNKNKVNKDAWLNTYADMITLILVFFILLYSMSSLDQEKYRLLVRAFTSDQETLEQLMLEESEIDEANPEPVNGGTEGVDISDIQDLEELYRYLQNYVKENNLQESVQVEKGKNIVYVRFMSTLFFEADRAVLKPQGREILDHVGMALARVERIAKFIRIDGHTAEAAPGTSTVNDRDLSTERANEVLKFLEEKYIKEPAKLYAVGYGLYRPIAPNDSEENRAKNRRVEILVGKQDALQDELDKIYKIYDGEDDSEQEEYYDRNTVPESD